VSGGDADVFLQGQNVTYFFLDAWQIGEKNIQHMSM
jgi:hypothetical protein